MNIAFDALPLIGGNMTGIGWCEAGQTTAMARIHPENNYYYSFFSRKSSEDYIKIERMQQFMQDIKPKAGHFSGLAYRTVSNFIPVPYKLFFGKDIDITHFFNYIAPPGVHGKTVITVHDMVYKAFPETVRSRTKMMLNTGLKRSMKQADIIVTDSEFSKSEIIKYFPQYQDKIRVVLCGVDLQKFRPCQNPERIPEVKKSLGIEGEYFLYLGTIEPRKNLERLISAYHIFAQHVKDAPKLVLAGGKGWLYDSIFQKVTDLKLTDKVIFTKYVPSEDMNPLMCGAIAFVFPSIYEGFGMPPLEAMACGVPVLASDSASLPEVTGDCAVVCDAYSEESIADGLNRLYSDTELRSELSRRGIRRAENFTWENSAEQLYSVYKELVK
ncbi:MAG: glycosyltransferase family 4 protein [Ruminococcus sp.]|nr:glycosyltransferase family 4 protein [Ruminococcus sp.]MDE7225346.1 glycosyltransferase family 4 protein [Ruminococcus sp.]